MDFFWLEWFYNYLKGVKMKLTKLSLIAALAVSTAMASDAKISGDAKVFYGTTDAGKADLFADGTNTMGDAAVSLDYSRDIADGVTFNAGMTGISTLGLEATLVGDTWVNHALKDRVWIDVANLTAKVGSTTAVIGRQKLDTPLAFTETWNIVENTFDAFTFVNSSLGDTTLVASAVTRANGGEFTNIQGGMGDVGEAIYTVGAISNITSNIAAQGWYYNVAHADSQKVWLQADAQVTDAISFGAQYAMAMADKGDDASIMSAKLAYDANDVSLSAAFSKANEDGQTDFANYGGYGGSKVYTEAWWNFGYVTSPGAQAITVAAASKIAALDVTAQYTTVTNDSNAAADEMNEITLTATTKIGPVDATLALINTSSDDDAVDGNTVQAYLTVPFSL